MIGYLAPDGRLDDLRTELQRQGKTVLQELGDLLLCEGSFVPAAWARNVWNDVEFAEFQSIGKAAEFLRARQRNWVLWPYQEFRRSKLIEEQLPPLKPKPLEFPSSPPASPLGGWTLLDRTILVYAPSTHSRFPNGVAQFLPPKWEPPSSAYLKLWEALARLGSWPQPGERAADFGSFPGGWTRALQALGCEVVSIDRAMLAPEIQSLERVQFLRKDAFKVKPSETGPLDWFLCDVICYPERLLELIEEWTAEFPKMRMVCTIKFQGQTDFDVIARFRKLPDSQIVHLFHNKHELTWIRSPGLSSMSNI